MIIKHQETHPRLDHPDCFGCRIASVRVSAAAMPTRHEATNNLTAAWDKQIRDDEAYKTLRKQGYQPERTNGCHELAQTDDVRFIEPKPLLWDQRSELLESTSDTPQVKVES